MNLSAFLTIMSFKDPSKSMMNRFMKLDCLAVFSLLNKINSSDCELGGDRSPGN